MTSVGGINAAHAKRQTRNFLREFVLQNFYIVVVSRVDGQLQRAEVDIRVFVEVTDLGLRMFVEIVSRSCARIGMRLPRYAHVIIIVLSVVIHCGIDKVSQRYVIGG